MIIYEPNTEFSPHEIEVSCRIEFENRIAGLPDRLWFRFPSDQRGHISDRSDGFLIASILLAMRAGESIHVKGIVSPHMLRGIGEYQRVFNEWFPRRFKKVEITCDELIPRVHECKERIIVTAFSGGVDSYFTLRSHIPGRDNNIDSQVTHILFSHGFDIELTAQESFNKARSIYQDMASQFNVGLLAASSNIHEFNTRKDWGIFHGTALIGTAHILGRNIGRLYVPSSHTYGHLIPWGSDPRIDPLLSSECMEVVHDGADYTRVEKTEAISGWPVTYDSLRVCINADGVKNCSECEKCLRTMATLDLFDALENYSTFSRRLPMHLIRRCRYFNSSDFAFPDEILDRAAALRRYDIFFNFSYAVARSRVLQVLRFVRLRLRDLLNNFLSRIIDV